MTTVKLSVSQHSTNSSCEGGDWGGFLNKTCCTAAFHGYLYALGKRANKTGMIFLNSSEQTSCLASMKRLEKDVSSCGIEQLTRSSGGCSEYSIDDVAKNLGDKLESLSENCNSLSSDGLDESCNSCSRSWNDIGWKHSKWTATESMICRFAVLVSLTSSRIADENNERIYECLSQKTSGYYGNIHDLIRFNVK